MGGLQVTVPLTLKVKGVQKRERSLFFKANSDIRDLRGESTLWQVGSEARFWHQWPGGKQGNSFPHAFAAAARVGWMDGLLQAWEAYLTNTPLGWRVTAITLRSDPKCRMFSNGMVLGCGNTGLAPCPGFAVLQALRRTWEVQPLPRRCCCRPLAGCWRQDLRGPGSSLPGLPIPATA